MSGVPMLPGASHEGPEDALGTGIKRGDYSGRLGYPGYAPHEAAVAQAPRAQGTRSIVVDALAAGADDTEAVFTARFAGTLVDVYYVPDEDITGAATNNRKISVINGGSDGNGSTEMAALTFASGTDADEGEFKKLTLSGTPANLDVAVDDQIVWSSAKVGTGIADPGGRVFVVVEAD